MDPNPQPSIGRVVIYNHPGSADGKFPTVELFVMSVYGGVFFNHSVEQGDGPSQWSWPPRV